MSRRKKNKTRMINTVLGEGRKEGKKGAERY